MQNQLANVTFYFLKVNEMSSCTVINQYFSTCKPSSYYSHFTIFVFLDVHFEFNLDLKFFLPCRSCSLDQWNKRRIPFGAIVLCFLSVAQVPSAVAAISVLKLNASGLIFAEPLTKLIPEDDVLPTVHVDHHQGTQILYYIKSTKYVYGNSQELTVLSKYI